MVLECWDREFLGITTIFQKNNIGWPQQPPTERVSDIGKKLNFWWSISQKGASIGHFGAWNDQIIRIRKFFWWNSAFEAVEASEVAEADEVNKAAEVLGPEKSLLRTSEASRFLYSSLFWCFEKLFWGVESWHIMLKFSTFSVGGCWGQLMLFFWKMVVVPKNSLSRIPEPSSNQI